MCSNETDEYRDYQSLCDLKIKNIWQELKEDGSFYKFNTNFLSPVQLSLKIFSYGKKNSSVFLFILLPSALKNM